MEFKEFYKMITEGFEEYMGNNIYETQINSVYLALNGRDLTPEQASLY